MDGAMERLSLSYKKGSWDISRMILISVLSLKQEIVKFILPFSLKIIQGIFGSVRTDMIVVTSGVHTVR